MVRNLWCSRL